MLMFPVLHLNHFLITKNYKILGKYIKDVSGETPDIETYIFVKDQISKYQLNIDITSKPLKNKMIEIETLMKFADKEESKKKTTSEKVTVRHSCIAKTIQRAHKQSLDRVAVWKFFPERLF